MFGTASYSASRTHRTEYPVPAFASKAPMSLSHSISNIQYQEKGSSPSGAEVQNSVSKPAEAKFPNHTRLPPGVTFKPLELTPPPSPHHPVEDLMAVPAASSSPKDATSHSHSDLLATCQPLGHRPRTSATAFRLYNRPYSNRDCASSHASMVGLWCPHRLSPSP